MDVRRTSRRDRLWIWLARLWIGAIIVFSVWETINYTGAVAFFAEWQYDKLGSFYPAITCLLMILFLSLPLLLIARWRQKYSKGQANPESAPLSADRMAASRWRNGFIVAALITACAILVIGIFTFFLPDDSEPVRLLTVTEATTPSMLGATELHGKVLYDKIAVFNEDTLLSHSRDRFAPVVAEGANQANFRYFVELPSDSQGRRAHDNAYRGVLRRGGLPGDLEKIYKYAGYKISDDYYTLFSSRSSMQREYLMYMTELTVLLIFFVVMQFIFQRRIQKIEKSAPAA